MSEETSGTVTIDWFKKKQEKKDKKKQEKKERNEEKRKLQSVSIGYFETIIKSHQDYIKHLEEKIFNLYQNYRATISLIVNKKLFTEEELNNELQRLIKEDNEQLLKEKRKKNPIFQKDNKFYFSDMKGGDEFGPFDSMEKALEEFKIFLSKNNQKEEKIPENS